MLRILAFGLLASLAACDTASQTSTDLSAEVRTSLDGLLLDEYQAEAIYARVLQDFGDVRPFSNIIGAEQRHASALETLYGRYGLDVPANPHSATTVDGYASVQAACAAGVDAEIANAALYEAILEYEMPADVRQVVTSNRDASLYNHLPAFQRCAS